MPDASVLELPAPTDNEIRVYDRSNLLVEDVALAGTKLFFIRCNNIVVRNCRIDYQGLEGSTGDCLAFTSCTNVVVERCTLFGATDECLDLWNCRDASVQYNVLGPGATTGHDKGTDHSSGLLCGGGTENVSVHHNLFIGNVQRNPICYGTEDESFHPVYDVRNNLVYDCYGGTQIGAGATANVIANLYLAPRRNLQIKFINEPYGVTGSGYVARNLIHPDMALLAADAGTTLLAEEIDVPVVATQGVREAAQQTLRWAGAEPAQAFEQGLLDEVAAALAQVEYP